ncbi:MAG: metallophosphoesterase family protein [Spirochaetaceae bacterium]|nr:metallophosphoesterase family protein [Spirochaetaceae bacterium]
MPTGEGRIAVVADTHDNWPALDALCRSMADAGCTHLLHCGDVCAPLTLLRLLDGFDGQVDLVAGNVDGDHYLMTTRTAGRANFRFHGAELAELTVGGRTVAMQHYPRLARALACGGGYHAVFYGHDHVAHVERIEAGARSVLLANPGTLSAMGKAATYGLYDPASNDLELVRLTV